jgi:hypothetical protein
LTPFGRRNFPRQDCFDEAINRDSCVGSGEYVGQINFEIRAQLCKRIRHFFMWHDDPNQDGS